MIQPQDYIVFSHTQRVSVTSDHPVSVVVVGVNILVFRLLSNRCMDLLQILCGCSLDPLLSVLK